jgi:hypothetical protein
MLERDSDGSAGTSLCWQIDGRLPFIACYATASARDCQLPHRTSVKKVETGAENA